MNETLKTDPEEPKSPAKMPIRVLLGYLRPGEFRGFLAVLFTLVSGAFFAGIQISKITTPSGPDVPDFADGDVTARFIISRAEVFDVGTQMVKRISDSKVSTESLINFRATMTVPEQDPLYDTIYREIKKGEVLYTRVSTYDSDKELTITRRFLQELGDHSNVRMLMVAGSSSIPSCLISDSEALLGFKATDGTINHGLHVMGPETLVRDLRTMYEKFLTDTKYSFEFKKFGQIISPTDVDDVIRSIHAWLGDDVCFADAEALVAG